MMVSRGWCSERKEKGDGRKREEVSKEEGGRRAGNKRKNTKIRYNR